MTDWLPWGACVMAGFLVPQALLLRAIARTPVGERPDLRAAWLSLLLFGLLSLGLYTLYLLYGERWVWYQ